MSRFDKYAAARAREAAPVYGFLCTYITYDKRASRPGEMVDSSSLRWSVAWQQDNLGAWQFNPHISCAGSAHKPKKHLSHACDKGAIADARPKLTARNDPRKSQVIHSALPRPMAEPTVSVRTADLAGRPCRLRDAFTEIALANDEACFDALVSGCRVELRVKWP